MALLDSVRKISKLLRILYSPGSPPSVTTVCWSIPSKQPRRQSRPPPLRDCLQWLRGGALLAMFPPERWLTCAGRAIGDRPAVEDAAARLALRTEAAVVPVFFEGATAYCSPGRRAASEPQDRQPASGVRQDAPSNRARAIGSAVPNGMLRAAAMPSRHRLSALPDFFSFQSIQADSAYLHPTDALPALSRLTCRQSTVTCGGGDRLAACCELAGNRSSRFLAGTRQIPRLLQEFGRGRGGFRKVGEGTGKTPIWIASTTLSAPVPLEPGRGSSGRAYGSL